MQPCGAARRVRGLWPLRGHSANQSALLGRRLSRLQVKQADCVIIRVLLRVETVKKQRRIICIRSLLGAAARLGGDHPGKDCAVATSIPHASLPCHFALYFRPLGAVHFLRRPLRINSTIESCRCSARLFHGRPVDCAAALRQNDSPRRPICFEKFNCRASKGDQQT